MGWVIGVDDEEALFEGGGEGGGLLTCRDPGGAGPEEGGGWGERGDGGPQGLFEGGVFRAGFLDDLRGCDGGF